MKIPDSVVMWTECARRWFVEHISLASLGAWLKRPAVRRGAMALFVVAVAALVVLFACRGAILRSYADRKIEKVATRFGLDIRYSGLRFSGLSTLCIEGLSVVPAGRDTLLSARDISVKINPWRMIFGRVDVTYLESHSLHLQFVKGDSLSNFDFIYPSRESVAVESDSVQSTDYNRLEYARNTERIFDVMFGLLPSDALLSDFRVGYRHGDYQLTIAVPRFDIDNNRFRTEIKVDEPERSACWISEGELLDAERNVRMKLYNKDAGPVMLPFLPFRWSAEVTFDTLSFNLVQRNETRQSASVSGMASVSGLALMHSKISPERVQLDRGEFDYRFNIGPNFIELDSTTRVSFNKLSFNPYLRAECRERWHFRASINKDWFEADDLFSSLPRGLFSNLEGMRPQGRLAYHMLFDVDMAQVDSLRLESQLRRDDFRIVQFGATDLRRMNSPFVYTAYDNGVAVRSFEVGEGNPDFRPLDRISPLLQMAVMQSEDGAFFHHNGFLIDCIRDAVVEDIKERRFARGGSTISMQLVKNVFLSRHKTIARKVEEALIVWLIEGGRLSSKERMFEVYMNIIEWGRGVYGANEAARYYFDKQAAELDINESIFLAGIVPAPKRALGSFTDSLELRPYMEGYFRILAQRFVVKGLISQQEADEIKPQVTLRGAAREAVLSRSEMIERADTASVAMAESNDIPLFPTALPPSPLP